MREIWNQLKQPPESDEIISWILIAAVIIIVAVLVRWLGNKKNY